MYDQYKNFDPDIISFAQDIEVRKRELEAHQERLMDLIGEAISHKMQFTVLYFDFKDARLEKVVIHQSFVTNAGEIRPEALFSFAGPENRFEPGVPRLLDGYNGGRYAVSGKK